MRSKESNTGLMAHSRLNLKINREKRSREVSTVGFQSERTKNWVLVFFLYERQKVVVQCCLYFVK